MALTKYPKSLQKVSTVSKTANYTAVETDDIILCNSSGGAFTVTLPAAATYNGKILTIKKTNSQLTAVTVDGNASETIDGQTTIKLTGQYDYICIISDGSNWHISEQKILNAVFVYTGNGYGSTNTSVRRYSTTGYTYGNAITYADSAANGGYFTINESGMYSITIKDARGTSFVIGVTVNGAELSTHMNAQTDLTKVLLIGDYANYLCLSGNFFLNAGDIVRVQSQVSGTGSEANSTTASVSYCRISKLD